MVIQRWQSVLLLCACLLMAAFSFCSLGQVQTPEFTLNFTALGLSYEGEPTGNAPSGYYLTTWYFFAVSLLSAMLPLLSIFCFKNLPLQKKLCLVEVLLIIAVCAIAASLGYNVEQGNIGWSSLICAPVLALIATIMAYQRINKDHKLLLSVDRLR